ncbi:ATP-binding protein [Salipaludibacillus sp. HK11]|uniref:ATP-binding protein n=1 Tax=Salipaludibacillus sp. HK11 TaxID=3394320 RepID=UPI0039FB9DBC
MILFASASMMLCMTFPIELDVGYIFDLRYIPFIIASLYGGYVIAFPLYLVLNIYRFLLGGDGILFSFYFSSILFMVIPLWSKKFIQQRSKQRIRTVGIISIITMIIFLIILSFLYTNIGVEYFNIAMNVLTTYVIGGIVILVLIEKIIVNEKKRQKYIQSDRLNVLSELSASVSHEIRNPLTVTSGFLQLLKTSQNLDNKEQSYIDLSLQELNRAEKIVSDFLSLAKPQAANMVYSNFKDEIEYVNNIMIAYSNMHQVKLAFTFKNTLYKRFDKNQMQQCLINLYKNGIEAMKETGGTLSIDILEEKGNISIQVKDTGIGMTKSDVLRLGEPYYSSKEEGTGLGMLMVYSTIDKLGGKIEVNSTRGVGTTFRISIPTDAK